MTHRMAFWTALSACLILTRWSGRSLRKGCGTWEQAASVRHPAVNRVHAPGIAHESVQPLMSWRSSHLLDPDQGLRPGRDTDLLGPNAVIRGHHHDFRIGNLPHAEGQIHQISGGFSRFEPCPRSHQDRATGWRGWFGLKTQQASQADERRKQESKDHIPWMQRAEKRFPTWTAPALTLSRIHSIVPIRSALDAAPFLLRRSAMRIWTTSDRRESHE